MTSQPRDPPQFYLTAPSPCPYLPGRQERKVFTHLVGRKAPEINDALTQAGFRRSQTISYRPACEGCSACISTRVPVKTFALSANLRRVAKQHRDIYGAIVENTPTAEQYSLFRAYLDARHSTGGMVDMSVLDYAMMVEESHVETRLVEYRTVEGRLVGVALTDIVQEGLSMVYSFYEPDDEARSLGTFMILDHIEKARALGFTYVYLGYWIDGSRKMQYKARFMPQERLTAEGWKRTQGS